MIQVICQWLVVVWLSLIFIDIVGRDIKKAEIEGARAAQISVIGTVLAYTLIVGILYGAGAFSVLGDVR